MHWQTLITTLLVTACSSYALWNVMPRAWRARVSIWLGRPAVAASGGCGGCDGCGSAKPANPANQKTTAGVSVIRIVRKPPVA